VHVRVHARLRRVGVGFVARHFWVCYGSREGMSDPDPHYTLSLSNHHTGQRLKIELFDLPFPGARSYRIRVRSMGQEDAVASKTMVAK
jgi:hypothetical protein